MPLVGVDVPEPTSIWFVFSINTRKETSLFFSLRFVYKQKTFSTTRTISRTLNVLVTHISTIRMRIDRKKKRAEQCYGHENEEVAIGDNSTMLLCVRSFVRWCVYTCMLTDESTTKATSDKFEEIKEKKRKLNARNYNSFEVVGENVIHRNSLFFKRRKERERKWRKKEEHSTLKNVARRLLMTTHCQGH